jgi:hypothetical protein
MAAVALVVALLALVVTSLGVLVTLTWRGDLGRIRDLAERLEVETRLEYLTTQTLGAMRDVARRHFRNDDRT